MVVNVPNVPGVPSVLFAAASQTLTLLTQDALGLFFGSPSSPWGIYMGGARVVQAETALSFDYKQQWSISDFPVERGGFESYNKVSIPFEVGFRFASGGDAANRQALLNSIRAIAGNTMLYDVVTPDAVYINVNIARYDYRQTATDGVGLMQVDVYATEIRQAGGGLLSNTQSPFSATQSNGGTVQGLSASTTQSAQTSLVTGANGRVSGPV